MSELHDDSYGFPRPEEAEPRLDAEGRSSYPTPGEIIGQIARTIAVCLALGLLARMVISFTAGL